MWLWGKIKVKPSHKHDGIPIYIHNHHQRGKVSPKKGKTYEEMYGEEKAKALKIYFIINCDHWQLNNL